MRITQNIDFVKLCDREDLITKSAIFIISEWPGNLSYREDTQRESCRPSPPMVFLLVDSEKDEIIGHARLCLLPNRPTSLYFESVLIAKDRRRRGLGRYLMMGVENWMRSNGFDRAFLGTLDRCNFYESIGYMKCDPIVLDYQSDDDYKYQYLTKRIGRM